MTIKIFDLPSEILPMNADKWFVGEVEKYITQKKITDDKVISVTISTAGGDGWYEYKGVLTYKD